jgi:hypothetical protein
MMFDQSWFDKLQINMREEGLGVLAIHVFKAGHACRYLSVKIEEIEKPGFFQMIHERMLTAWKVPDPLGPPCPQCGNDQHMHTRRYEGKTFCSFCGYNYS